MVDLGSSHEAARVAALRRYAVLDTQPEDPFDRITDLVRTILDVPVAGVSFVDADRQWFKSITGTALCSTPREVSFCTHAIHRHGTLVISDAACDSRFSANPLVTREPFIRSYLGVPLKTLDGHEVGVLCAIDRVPRAFTNAQVDVLSRLAAIVVDLLELRQLAASDGLTGAMTRRSWLEATNQEIARSRRHGRDAAVVLFDLDHFKSVNDGHGHAAGDAVLRAVARRCEGVLRKADLLGRLGGEEFAVLMPEADQGRAMQAAERMRAALADQPVDVGVADLPITASFGVCSLDPGMSDAEAWLAAADAGLYAAKAQGRNRCCAATRRLPLLTNAA